MTILSEFVDDVILATSTVIPNVRVLLVNQAAGSSLPTLGIRPATFVGTADITSTVTLDGYAIIEDIVNATNTAFTSIQAHTLLLSSGRASSSIVAITSELAISTAAATSALVSSGIRETSMSSAVASSSLPALHTESSTLLTSTASASSSVTTGLGEFCESIAAATSTVTATNYISVLSLSAAAATSTVFDSSVPVTSLVISAGVASSTVLLQMESHALFSSTAEAVSEVWYLDPARVAWVMNTESTAVSWYNNFDFESITMASGKTLAVGPDGLYEFTGNTDEGSLIRAEVVSGFTDFGVPQTKRLDEMYFGYTSDGNISVTTEAYECGLGTHMYSLEQRTALAPRNSRVTPGKGLWGRYWRLGIRNVDGADFEIHDATVDLAVSPRRL